MTAPETRTTCPVCVGVLVREECAECAGTGQCIGLGVDQVPWSDICPWCSGAGDFPLCPACGWGGDSFDSVPESPGTFEEG